MEFPFMLILASVSLCLIIINLVMMSLLRASGRREKRWQDLCEEVGKSRDEAMRVLQLANKQAKESFEIAQHYASLLP